MNNVLFSVITVCYNAEETIEKTIRSVIDQDFDDFEYIIVDGASSDGTLDIIRRYLEDDKGGRIRFVSEPDEGLYYAMNKAIGMANGHYIEFLNSGDEFVGRNVLSAVAGFMNSHTGDVFYGNIIYRYPDGTSSERVYTGFCGTKFYYLLGDCINHQAIFASRDCFDIKDNFDTNYQYSADREWMIRIKKAGKKYVPMNQLICYYSLAEGSKSVANEKAMWDENKDIIKKHFPVGFVIYCLIDKIRNSRILSGTLHRLYELVFLRKKNG